MLVVVGALALVLVAGALAATRVRWSGGLGQRYGGAGVSAPLRVGQAYSFGMDELRAAGGRVRIESVRLHDRHPGLAFVGAVVHELGHGGVGSAVTFPPTFPHVPMRPAGGAVIPAHSGVYLVVGVKALAPGTWRLHGVDVRYRERWHGIDLRRVAHLGLEVELCAVRTTARVAPCKPPAFED